MTLQARHLTQAARSVARVRRSTESPLSTWPHGKRKLWRPAGPGRFPLGSDAGRPIAAASWLIVVPGRLRPRRVREGHSKPPLDPSARRASGLGPFTEGLYRPCREAGARPARLLRFLERVPESCPPPYGASASRTTSRTTSNVERLWTCSSKASLMSV